MDYAGIGGPFDMKLTPGQNTKRRALKAIALSTCLDDVLWSTKRYTAARVMALMEKTFYHSLNGWSVSLLRQISESSNKAVIPIGLG